MENLYVWLFLFAGATIAFLGMLLLASERELKKKRRELDQAVSNHTDGIIHLRGEAQVSEADSAVELMTKNRELSEKVASLSSRLEESQKAVDELQTEQHRLVSAESDNQQLDESIVNLKTQLETSEIRLSESASRAREIADCNSKLETEVAELTQQLQASQGTIVELQAGQARMLLDAQTEHQKLCAENQRLQQDIVEFRNQLQTSETLLATNASQYTEIKDRYSQLQLEVAELKQQVDQLMMKNNDLSEESNALSSKLAASQRTVEELQTIQEGAQSENQHLQAANQELQRGIAKLNIEIQTSESRLSESSRQAQDIADHHSKLQAEATDLKEQLQSSQKAIEALQVEQQRLSGVHFENQKLQQEMTDLREQLQTSESRLGESSRQNQEAADRYARLQGEVNDLQQQLEETQPKLRDLESSQQQLANVECRETIYRDRQRDLEAQIAELQRELSVEGGKVQELDAARKRLAEMEHFCQEQRDENRRLEEEISGWQERFARSEEYENAPLQQLSASPIEPAALIEGSDDESRAPVATSDLSPSAQSTTNNGGEWTRESIESAASHRVDEIPFGMEVSQIDSPINGSSENNDNHARLRCDDAEAGMAEENRPVTAPTVPTSRRRKWRMAKIPAVVVLAVVGGVAMGSFGTRYFGPMKTAVAPETVADEQSVPIETVLQTVEIKPAPGLQGKFKITRPTAVFSGPSEDSALITRIEPGIKINVVGSRGGWLEIRSNHGRPPGFVRQEAAVKIGQN